MERRVRSGLTPAEGRRFAFPVGGIFLAVAGILWWRGHQTVAVVLGGLGGLLLLLGLAVPGRLGPPYRGWMGLAVAISKVTTPVFMGLVYYAVLTPTGLLRRTFGRDPMVHAPGESTYWHERPEDDRRGDLNRQF